jgi:hypothetical protein
MLGGVSLAALTGYLHPYWLVGAFLTYLAISLASKKRSAS